MTDLALLLLSGLQAGPGLGPISYLELGTRQHAPMHCHASPAFESSLAG